MEVFVAELVANVKLSKTAGNNGGWIVITTGWGIAVAIAVYSVRRISGGHVNPAVTLGLASIGELEAGLVPTYLTGQVIGGFIGAILVWLTYKPHWEVTSEAEDKLSCFSTGPAIPWTSWNFFAEFIGTAVLVFGALAIGANAGELSEGPPDLAKAFSTGLNPLLIGLLVFGIGLSLGGPTGYAINPARDLSPRLAHQILPIAGKGDSNWSYAWIPVVGPILGGIAGAFLFQLLGF